MGKKINNLIESSEIKPKQSKLFQEKRTKPIHFIKVFYLTEPFFIRWIKKWIVWILKKKIQILHCPYIPTLISRGQMCMSAN